MLLSSVVEKGTSMSEKIVLRSGGLNETLYEKAQAVVLFLCRECVPGVGKLGLPESICAAVRYTEQQDPHFTDTGKITRLVLEDKGAYRSVILAGVGVGKGCTPNHLRIAAGNAVRELKHCRIRTAVTAAPLLRNPTRPHYVKALAEGLLLGSYAFTKYKSDAEATEPMTITIGNEVPAAEAVIQEATLIAQAVCHARDLANEPGNVLTPEMLAHEAEQVAKDYDLKIEVLDEKAMRRLGMEALLAVGAGSVHPPRLVCLRYARGGDLPFTAFVGKGITFDSGGISLKPGEGMGEMKDDMTGAAVVLGAIQAIAALDLKVNILGILACAENMPSGSAQRPGDIVRSAAGKTIEVVNTDAEGRMVLADAVWYAGEQGAERIVDIATLTGAVIIALGEHTSGIIANDDALAETIKKAGHRVGEEWWQLPLVEEAPEMIKSTCADVKNSAGRPGGCITGGAFIGAFVKQGLPWAHLDIGGTSSAKKTEGHIPEGCSAFGTATLIEFAKSLQK